MTPVPVITEQAAVRQLAAARRALARAERALDETPSGYSIWTRQAPTLEWLAAEQNVEHAERAVTAAENRLDAIRSQAPVRHSGAWAQGHAS